MSRTPSFWKLSCAIALSLLAFTPTVAVAQHDPVPALQAEITDLEAQFGENSPELAAKLLELGHAFHESKNHPEALTQYERALAILEQHPEQNQELRLQVINALVQIHLDLFQTAEALQYLQQRQQLEVELYPDDVTRQLEILQRLAEGYSLLQQTDRAVQEYENLLEQESERLGSRTHPDLVRRLHDVATTYQRLSQFEKAQDLYDRVAQIFAEHPDAFSDLDRAILLNNQAMLSPREENFVQMYRQLRQMSQMLDQPGIVTQATKLPITSITFYGTFQSDAAPAVLLQYNWATILSFMGDTESAIAAWEKADDLLQQLNPDAYWLQNILLQQLIALSVQEGDFDRAITYALQYQTISEQAARSQQYPEIFGFGDDPNFPTLPEAEIEATIAAQRFMQTLWIGTLYHMNGDYQQAEELYLSLATELRNQPPATRQNMSAWTNFQHSTLQQYLAYLYLQTERYTEARERLLTALELNRQSLPDAQAAYAEQSTVTIRLQLAQVERILGNDAAAIAQLQQVEQLYAQMQTFIDSTYAQIEQERPFSLNDQLSEFPLLREFARTYAAQGNIEGAIAYYQKSLAAGQRYLELIELSSFGSEQQKTLAATFGPQSINPILSWHLHTEPNNPEVAAIALTSLLQNKGKLLDLSADTLATVRQQAPPDLQQQLERLIELRAQQANALYQSLGRDLSPDEYQAYVFALNAQTAQIENQLAGFRTFQSQQSRDLATIAAVQAQIPTDAVLVEFTRYQPLDVRTEEAIAEERYAAYTLTAAGQLRWVDLGPTAAIDDNLRQWRRALQTPQRPIENQATPLAQTLYTQLLAPILEELDPGITHLLLSPEGNLHLIPFAALVNPQERYLLADYQLTYLNSGRDLLRLDTPVVAQNPPLLVAAPDYQHTADTDAIAQTRAIPTLRALELRDLQVTPLPGTLAEVNAIAPLLDNAQVKLAGEATENAVKAARSPQILHIATHGFFLRDPDFAALTDTLELPRQAFGQSQNGAQPFFNQGNIWRQEHPLLRSGLALAGFNQRQSGSEDGVLTALEISSLDLRGTQLAVLSACETGLGETPVGQGVYGLRRALSIAGAQSQVISLWQVDDRATQELMVNYYQALNQGQGRSEALRQARLTMARSADYSHPFYWAAFIPSGDWRPL